LNNRLREFFRICQMRFNTCETQIAIIQRSTQTSLRRLSQAGIAIETQNLRNLLAMDCASRSFLFKSGKEGRRAAPRLYRHVNRVAACFQEAACV
jgi:hypothetical protein